MEYYKKTSKLAFTLAEVLITLGVIGIIASITIPQLMRNYKAKVYETAFKKSYSNLSKAFTMTKIELGESNLNGTYAYYDVENESYPNWEQFLNVFYEQIKAESDAKSYKYVNYNNTKFDKTLVYIGVNDYPMILKILADGSGMGATVVGGNIRFFIDTNGYAKPNRLGFDIFRFHVSSKDALMPDKMSRLYTEEELENEKYPTVVGYPCSIKSTQLLNGIGCAYYAMNDINPDDNTKSYWKNLPR